MPSRVARLLLIVSFAFFIAAAPRAQQAVQTLDGVLNIVWGDPHPSVPTLGNVRFFLTTADGNKVELQMGGREAEAQAFFNRQVTLTGRQAAGTNATGSQGTFVVDTINASLLAAPGGPQTQAVTGTRRVIYLLVKFAGDAVPGGSSPRNPSFYTDFTNPDTPPGGAPYPTTLNGFFKKTSWNQFSWIADVGGVGGVGAPGGWLTLSGAKSTYANCGWSGSCANLNLLSAEAIALGKAQGINFTVYDNINFVLSNDLDCCAWGGGYSFDGKSYGATWEPPWGQEADTYSHEMSHSIGLPHSGWVYFAYDSPFDTMSMHRRTTAVNCGTYSSANQVLQGQPAPGTSFIQCVEPGGGYIGAHKNYLGWIPSPNLVVADVSTPVSVSLEGLSLPLASGIKMIRICVPGYSCDPAISTARFFTVEARIKALSSTSQYDNAIPSDGVYIHDVRRDRPGISGSCFFNSQSGWAVPIDSSPGDYNSSTCSSSSSGGLFNAGFIAGQSYTNATYGFRVNVVSRTSTTFAVTVENTSFTDPTLTGSVTAIKTVHITELRSRVNAQRVRFGLSNYSFSDATLTAGVTPIRIEHIAELRAALAEAYVARGITPPSYTDPTLTRNVTLIRKEHIQELRNAVILLEGS